ncbi:hypothetical protein G6N74_28520 [Mesorhizobium sp. CGMCC 1.15528]|uniref:Hedgehog/Intein (Hint) domain-containing protein n=1 Tax=Mesorhizobium zhangyense TaxID=1776730 RepID=A0A7C9VAF3_9HYPH|nr:hypothetical protein [Mesorhizobium zhangyense]NGN45005.1 hypothetical protein [Mesorhizobium zhangyense]
MSETVHETYIRYRDVVIENAQQEFLIFNGDGQSDFNALAHALTSAGLVFNHDVLTATIYGEGREFSDIFGGPSTFVDSVRDSFNNRVGVKISQFAQSYDLPENALAILAADALKRGLLIVDEHNDSRIYLNLFQAEPVYDGPSTQAADEIFVKTGIRIENLGTATGEGTPIHWDVLPDDGPIPGDRPTLEELTDPRCFPAGTEISLVGGKSKSIEMIDIGDTVLAFESAAGNRNALVHGPVVRVFKNVTTEWLKLSTLSEETAEQQSSTRQTADTASVTYATPGHAFLNEFGAFEPIEQLVNRGGMIVLENGTLCRVTAERIVYSEATASMFEQAEVVRYATVGGLACAPYVERGWATYNFEVEKYHTYIANGWRVHNDSQAYIDAAGAIGQAFGTQLGMMLTEGESQFTQLAAGTALGLVARNLAEVIMDTGFHVFSGDQLNFGSSLGVAIRQLEDVTVDLATAASGTVSSFLLAELGESMGLEGFGAQLFNVSTGAYAGSLLNTAMTNWQAGHALLEGADFTEAFGVLPGAVGTFFGSALAREILPAETIEGQIGGSLGSIAGSALGSSFLGTVGSSLGFLGNFLLPGIGGFFGTLIGTFLGDLFGDEPDPQATIDLFMLTGLSADRGGLLNLAAQWESVDGFPHDATTAWAEAVHKISLEYVRTVGGFDVANAYVDGLQISQELIDNYGMMQGELVRVLQRMKITLDGSDMDYFVNGREVGSAEQMVDGAIAGFIQDSQVIGGDLLLKRAAANSTAVDTPTLSGDMSVAEQYGKYLNDRAVVNALIASNPDSIFAAAWAVSLAQANDLKLAQTNVADFHGGLGGFMASLAHAGVSVTPDDVTLTRNAAGQVTVDIKVAADFDVPGIVDVFANDVEVISQNGYQTLRLTFSNSMSGVGYHNVTGVQVRTDGFVNVIGETTGRDVWFATDDRNYVFSDSGVRVIGVNDAEVISSDDIVIGANGNDRLDGGEGWDWISGGGGDDILTGGTEADVLMGGAGNDTLNGGFDLDYLDGGAGADVLNGGPDPLDWDTAGYAKSNAAVTINLATGAASGGHAAGDQLNGILNLVGSAFNDQLTGNEYRNTLEGGAGADVLNGGTNSSTNIYDFASYFRASEAVIASLANPSINTGDAAGDTYINIRGLEGSAFGDTLYGNSGNNELWGHGGNDILVVGAGSDTAYGSFGFDVMSYRTHTSGITINLQNWSDSTAVVDDDGGIGIEAFEATEFADVMIGRDTKTDDGQSENDVLFGLGGDDNINGGAGHDYLYGGKGDDALRGSAGNDSLRGEDGNDTLIGGEGNDQYVFGTGHGPDSVQDFVSASTTASGDISTANALGVKAGGIVNTWVSGFMWSTAANALFKLTNGGSDTLVLEGGISLSSLTASWSGETLQITNGTSGDVIRIAQQTVAAARVENISVQGIGPLPFFVAAALGRSVNGSSKADVVFGLSGNETLDGGAGDDSMVGGAGDDIYYVASAGDRAIESANGGADIARASVNWTLSDNVERLELQGTGNFSGIGNGLDNTLVGNSGNNTLNGGTGKDYMDGRVGNDTYVVDAVGDRTIEDPGEGTDTVRSYLSWTIGDNIEQLELLGASNLSGGGNELSNILSGNAGDNSLSGGGGNDEINGGSGADTLSGGDGNDTLNGEAGIDQAFGGAGNDIFIVSSSSDETFESVDNGTDTVRSYITWTLADNIERLELIGTALNGTGNTLNNTLVGNSEDNLLNGGLGDDAMSGGTGNDIYIVSSTGDQTIELETEGADSVRSYISWSLNANIETLELQGTDDLAGAGNSLHNTLVGNAGNNYLSGSGGNDNIRGGAGSDTFAFNTTLGTGNVDRISDYSVADDSIRLGSEIFTGLTAGALSSAAFRMGSTAADASDRIIYDSTTGSLLFDEDGNGAMAAVQFAILSTGLAMTAGEFFVV